MPDIVAEEEHPAALAAPLMLAIAQRHDDDVGAFEHIARNAKRLGQPKRFGRDGHRQARHQYCTVSAISPKVCAT